MSANNVATRYTMPTAITDACSRGKSFFWAAKKTGYPMPL